MQTIMMLNQAINTSHQMHIKKRTQKAKKHFLSK